MTEAVAVLIRFCGLSHLEAAKYLSVSVDTVISWSCGRRKTPVAALDKLADLAADIEDASCQFLWMNSDYPVNEVMELGISKDDGEARTMGWPSVSVHAAVLGQIIARGMADDHQFKIVPKSSTSMNGTASLNAGWAAYKKEEQQP